MTYSKDKINAVDEFVASVVISGAAMITLFLGLVGIGSYFGKKELYQKAISIADINRDGNLSLEEKIKMYQEMGIPFEKDTERRPTYQELSDYVKKYQEERKWQK